MRILIIKLDGIGDLALALPALRGLTLAYPAVRLDLVVSSFNESWRTVGPWLGYISHHRFPWVSRKKGRGKRPDRLLWRLITLGWALRRNRYDAAIDLRIITSDYRGKLIAWLSGAPIRIGGIGAGEWALTQAGRESEPGIHQSDLLLERLRLFAPTVHKASFSLTNISLPLSHKGPST